jgi:hypothetical protein
VSDRRGIVRDRREPIQELVIGRALGVQQRDRDELVRADAVAEPDIPPLSGGDALEQLETAADPLAETHGPPHRPASSWRFCPT